ncbi:MAG: hypothetical protein P8J33_18235, partial [Pirellulaceae bacterium]|nr:hypothetical protein [Pirellulaceae bacterium]
MKLLCTSCGDGFTITAEQLGTRGKCPHCKATIILPKAADSGRLDGELIPPSMWMERWFSILGAVFLHVLLVGVLFLIPYQYFSGDDLSEGDEVNIGTMNRVNLEDSVESTLQLETPQLNSDDTSVDLFSEQMLSNSSSALSSRRAMNEAVLNPGGGAQGSID